MALYNKKVLEHIWEVPLYKYFNLLEDEKESFIKAGKLKSNHIAYKNKIEIDRKYLQRLIEPWLDKQGMEYISSFYRGLDKIDSFVIVDIKTIIKVFDTFKKELFDTFKKELTVTSTKDTEESLKTRKSSKGLIDDFYKELVSWKANDIKVLLINGQHRLDVHERFLNSELKITSEFNDGEEIKLDGNPVLVHNKFYRELPIELRLELLETMFTFVVVDEIETLDDLRKIVKFHNTGNSWTVHQDRMRNPSYIARKFSELDELELFKQIMKNLGQDKTYSIKKNGVSLLALQLFKIYTSSKDVNYDPRILTQNDLTFDKMVHYTNTKYTKKVVDSFIELFKKIMGEINSNFLTRVTRKNNPIKTTIKLNVTLLKIYFLHRIVIEGKIDKVFKTDNPYTINDVKKFVENFIDGEVLRRSIREQLNDRDKYKFDDLINESSNGNITQKQFSEELSKLKEDEPKDGYVQSLGSIGSPKNLMILLKKIFSDFEQDVNSKKLIGIVNQVGERPSDQTKRIYKEEKVKNGVSSFDESEFSSELDYSHSDNPFSKGGDASLGNIETEHYSINRSKKDNH